MKDSTKETIEFAKLLHAFQQVERSVSLPGIDRRENDAEHSYVLAMLAWYLVDTLGLKLNKDKLFQAALAHDLVEVYAGDTGAFTRDPNLKSTKQAREKEAKEKISKQFPTFRSLQEAIDRYENQSDEESVFVYALDKLVPILLGILNDGRDWKRENISFDEIMEYKKDKIKANKEIYILFQELMAFLGKDKLHYFNP